MRALAARLGFQYIGSRAPNFWGFRSFPKRKNNPGYGPERFTYQPESNSYRCAAGEQLNYVGLNVRNRAHGYIGSAKRSGACSQKAQCTTGRYKYLAIHIHEPGRQRARELAQTPEFAKAQPQRTKVEALFAQLKNQIGLRRPAATPHEVRSGAVLACDNGAEHPAPGAVPQPASNTAGYQRLESRTQPASPLHHPATSPSISDSFNAHAWLQQAENYSARRTGRWF